MVSAAKLTKSEAHSKQFQSMQRKCVRSLLTLTAQQLSDLAAAGPKEGVNYNSMLVSRPVKRTGYNRHYFFRWRCFSRWLQNSFRF